MKPLLHHGTRFRHYVAVLVLFALAFFATQALIAAQDRESLTADEVKAGFISNFTRYIEWPSPMDADRTHFHICTAGEDGVVDQLESAVHGKVVDNRSMLVTPLQNSADVSICEVLYVGEISRSYDEQLAAALAGRPVLTVGSKHGFLRDTGVLTFVLEDNRVRFDIKLDLAESVNLRFDSRLLALARRTGRGTK